MLIDTYNMLVHAQAETVWKLLLDRVDNPQNYLHGVNAVRIIERSPVGVIREMEWEGKNDPGENPAGPGQLPDHHTPDGASALYRRDRQPCHSVSRAEPCGPVYVETM